VDLIRYYVIHYDREYFIKLPEIIVRKLHMNVMILDVIAPIEIRRRSNVRDWMLSLPITLEDLYDVGW